MIQCVITTYNNLKKKKKTDLFIYIDRYLSLICTKILSLLLLETVWPKYRPQDGQFHKHLHNITHFSVYTH